MLDQSTEFNMLGCLLTAFASGSFARFNCDVFHFVFYTMSSILFSTRCLPFCFPTSSKTVSLSCSFCFHADSNRATAHGSSERRLYASRDIRSIRIAITVPCQQYQQESIVMPLSCICKKTASLRCCHIFLRCQRQYAYLGFVIRNASFAQLQNCLVTMASYFCFAVPAPLRLFWVIVLCTISVFIPIENPHLTIVHFRRTLRVYTQSAINFGSMPKHPMRV